MTEQATHLPLIGDKAPSFVATTTQGQINFPKDYEGKWVILFSHPADFTPVCTTEFMTFANMADDLAKLNCELVGLSIDSLFSHLAWIRTIYEKIEFDGMKNVQIRFPLIADLTMEVAKKYGMLHPDADSTHAVRAVFIIDPKGIVRTLMYYPSSTGRNMEEIKRVLIALQTADKHNVATPANWVPGKKVIVPPPGSCGTILSNEENAKKSGYEVQDWFFTTREI